MANILANFYQSVKEHASIQNGHVSIVRIAVIVAAS